MRSAPTEADIVMAARQAYQVVVGGIAVVAGLLSYLPLLGLFGASGGGDDVNAFCSNRTPTGAGGDGVGASWNVPSMPFGIECSYSSSTVFHDLGTVSLLANAALLILVVVFAFTWGRRSAAGTHPVGHIVVSLLAVGAALPWVGIVARELLILSVT